MKLEEKFLSAVRELIPPGSEVTVALSGGADSAALLGLLRAAAPAMSLRLSAAHFHHGLRGAEADRDEAFCRQLCADWGIRLTVGRGDTAAHAAGTGQSFEAAARDLRYAFLEQAAAGLIATAHNADDNAETVLLHLIRGTGPRGLGGIPPKRGRIVRPLLGVTRAEILDWLEGNGVPHVEDSTNAEDDCLRNRVRHRLLPLFREENPRFSEAAGRAAALVRAEDTYLSRLAAEAADRCRTGEVWSCAALSALEPVLLRRILLSMLETLKLESPAERCVRDLERLISGPKPSAVLTLPGGARVHRRYDALLLRGPDPVGTLPPTALTVPGTTVLPDGLGTIRCTVTKNSNFGKNKPNTFVLRCDMICGHEVIVRGRRPGDRLRLSGGSKPVKDLMIDRKIPAPLRDAVPILTLDGSPAAVFGVGADPAFIAGPEEMALVLSYESPLFPERSACGGAGGSPCG